MYTLLFVLLTSRNSYTCISCVRKSNGFRCLSPPPITFQGDFRLPSWNSTTKVQIWHFTCQCDGVSWNGITLRSECVETMLKRMYMFLCEIWWHLLKGWLSLQFIIRPLYHSFYIVSWYITGRLQLTSIPKASVVKYFQ